MNSKKPRAKLESAPHQPEPTRARSAKRQRPTRFYSQARLARALRTLAAQAASQEDLRLTAVGRVARAALARGEGLEAAGVQRHSQAKVASVLPQPEASREAEALPLD
jgi:hypothetical protein